MERSKQRNIDKSATTLSIITVNYNNAYGLERTINSVVGQSTGEFEYIVIDGGSSDGSFDIIESYANNISYWVSEKDAGIYNAMNKGIKQASGKFCLFLNSGDVLATNTIIEKVLDFLSDEYDVFYAFPSIIGKHGNCVIRYDEPIDVNFFLKGTLNHQNSIISKSMLVRMGMYREDFRIVSDWFFFLKASYQEKCRFKRFPETIAFYRDDGISGSDLGGEISKKEWEIGIKETFGDLAPSIFNLMEFRGSVYGNIVNLFGYSKVLHFILKSYRYLARRVSGLRTVNRRQRLA